MNLGGVEEPEEMRERISSEVRDSASLSPFASSINQLRKHTREQVRAIYESHSFLYLSDEHALHLCRLKGDKKGSLKLAVVLS